MTITGIFLLCVLPFLGQWEQFKYMDLYGRAYADSYHYIFEYPLSILLVLSIVLICVGIYNIVKNQEEIRLSCKIGKYTYSISRCSRNPCASLSYCCSLNAW